MKADEPILAQIQTALDGIEGEQDARILFAVESGSRAWGFASPDSDYDVRFVYKRNARDYVRIREQRDVIELPITGDLDINGWDIVKALTQFRKSNPALLEWLHSPIVYRVHGTFAENLRERAALHFSPRRMTYHYLSMAKQNYRLSIENKPEVSLKKYLYVLRPLACILWLEQNDSPPPTSIHDILAGIELRKDVYIRLIDLMERKRNVAELGTEPHDTLLDAFIDSEIARIGVRVAALPDDNMDAALLDELLWDELGV
jgi:predicted nucleotidyltransferase